MKIADCVYVVASGDAGFSLTHPIDCTVYLIDCGGELVLIDAGCGLGTDLILSEIQRDGFNPQNINAVLLTHGHGDHIGGAKALAEVCDAKVYAMPPVVNFIQRGDLKALSITPAIEMGMYPDDFSIQPFQVCSLENNQTVKFGNIELTAHLAEGHSAGHACYIFSRNGVKSAFVGDIIALGGKISLQPIWDCNLQAYLETLSGLGQMGIDRIYPGHGCFSLSRGFRQFELALKRIAELKLPLNSIE